MPYIGRSNDKISNVEILTNLVFDGSSSYSITKNSVPFTPNSAQSLLISIDGVVQATNFSVNSSTIDFGVAIPSTSTCNFFLHYGTGVMTVPSDGSVTESKIGSGAVTSSKLSSGKVLNVVQGSHSTSVTNSTTTYADTGLTASITPISTSNKILVLVNQSFLIQDNGGGAVGADIRLMRDSTAIVGNQQRYQVFTQSLGSTNQAQYNRYTMNILDEPSTTSSIVYKTQCVSYTGGDYIATSPSSFGATIILMEVSG